MAALYQLIEMNEQGERIETDDVELTEAQLDNLLVEMAEEIQVRGLRAWRGTDGRIYGYICTAE